MKGINYDDIADSYDELYRQEQLSKVKLIMKYFTPENTRIMLDVGCGTGLSSSLFRCKRIGLDNSERLLRKADGLFKVLGNAEELPFKNKSFDYIISLTAIHNFRDYKKALLEMIRVSRELIIVSVLKRSSKFTEITKYIEQFKIKKKIEHEKDIIFLFKPC